MLQLSRTYGAPKDGDRLLELGTGWLHWEAITARLFFDIEGVLFDVWDNRQMGGIKNYLSQLEQNLGTLSADLAQLSHARTLIAEIRRMTRFEELYERLGFTYVVDPNGNPGSLKAESFDLVVSGGVLEHILSRDAPAFVKGIAAVLKPGGLSVHGINIRDHLGQYDSTVFAKQYLRYPNWIWHLCLENKVQYINRIQRPDWLQLFADAGLRLLEEEVEPVNITNMRVAKCYQAYAKSDLACGGLRLVHSKLKSNAQA
jgi:SAM-dependent methyltransferase